MLTPVVAKTEILFSIQIGFQTGSGLPVCDSRCSLYNHNYASGHNIQNFEFSLDCDETCRGKFVSL